MRQITTALAAALLSSFAIAAEADPVVVELYTSQGCSSCPPADELMTKLAERDDVIPLALHVDYWDYLGWADAFANPAYTKRQKAYARVANLRSVYTPQMIVGGQDHVIGNRPMELMDHIQRQRDAETRVAIALSRSGSDLSISLSPQASLPSDMVVQLVHYTPAETVVIGRGENRGRTITYTNIVTRWEEIGSWNGRQVQVMRTKAVGAGPVVVIVQKVGQGPIIGAAILK